MLFKSTLLAGLATSVAAALAARGCNDYVLISARGTSEPQGPSFGFRGMIKQTLSSVPGGVEYDVVYPGIFDPTQQTTLIGAKDIEKHVNNGFKACPDQKYALLGYSQGATVVLEAFQKLAATEAGDQIKAVVLIGNPYQVRNQRSTVDQNGESFTRDFDGILLPLAGTLNLRPKLPQNGEALNICFIGDPVCTGVEFAISSPAHLAYGLSEPVQTLGADHLIAKLGN
ncbi:hypothetical protein NLG97_g1889 [Lecanicillium saksenae]|uniref:Uncharacterized protein n=1 Tax=Lecanicillium saksenae TaxID=468837 RepID=A0ACC1R6K2_9HYPO|nr:hypothetical protein NLG97_g1889 [Lecanicillium saksenae]